MTILCNTAETTSSGAIGDIPIPGFLLDRVLSDEEIREVSAIVDPFALPFVLFDQIGALPNQAGVYFLLLDDAVIYVGQSKSLAIRWRGHTHLTALQQPGARLAYLLMRRGPYLDGFRCQIELHFINQLRPRLNRHIKGRH
jgi:hypothetical protein